MVSLTLTQATSSLENGSPAPKLTTPTPQLLLPNSPPPLLSSCSGKKPVQAVSL